MATGRMDEAEAACGELAGLLRRVGVVLPSLRVDPLSYTRERPYPLVELGRCNLETVRRLIQVLAKAER
ncbi:hypothetical protein ACGFOU_31320 [Streptomyces sp. NPDC048595]|uniref:hypothetical protein n=1 Tax=Streptomyces sp. NPDC048595 TaxID=3365576 RepID=UPI00371342A6